MRILFAEDDGAGDLAVTVQGERDQGTGRPCLADGSGPETPIGVHGDGFAEVRCDRPGSDQEGEEVGGSLVGLDTAAEADLPGGGIGFHAGEEPARLDSGDLLGDVEQGVENGLDLEGGAEEVTAFQEGIDRSGERNDLVRGNFEREVDGAARKPCGVERCHFVSR
jgi:hypothetical protein